MIINGIMQSSRLAGEKRSEVRWLADSLFGTAP